MGDQRFIDTEAIQNLLKDHPEHICYQEFAQNSNDLAVTHMFENPAVLSKYYAYFSLNENERAVEHMLEHPDNIDWGRFSLNKHPKAVEYNAKLEQDGKTIKSFTDTDTVLCSFPSSYLSTLWANTNDDIVTCLLTKYESVVNWSKLAGNSNEHAVSYILENVGKCIKEPTLSSNCNSRIVSMLLDNKELINWTHFSANTHDMAVLHLLSHPYKIDWTTFSGNSNKYAVEYMLKDENRDNIYKTTFQTNSNDVVVSYLLRKPHLFDLYGNTNSKAVEYCLSNKVVNKHLLAKNTNDLAVNYLLSQPDITQYGRKDCIELMYNSHPKIAQHILTNVIPNIITLHPQTHNQSPFIHELFEEESVDLTAQKSQFRAGDILIPKNQVEAFNNTTNNCKSFAPELQKSAKIQTSNKVHLSKNCPNYNNLTTYDSCLSCGNELVKVYFGSLPA